MAIKVYTSDVSKLYVGTSAVTKAYVGTTQVWSGGSQPAHDYSQDYTTLNFSEAGTFKLSGNSIDYSTDDGSTWTTLANNTVSPSMAAGTKVLLKRTHSTGATGKIVVTGRYVLEGNSMSLVYGDNFTGQTSLSGHNLVFEQLFVSNSGLTSAENFILPATTLSQGCYKEIFMSCSSLATAPELPATTMAQQCYQGMFRGTAITTAPALPATTLADRCYYFMFFSCTSLTTAPVLSATTLASSCYSWMFYNCTSLTTAPALPATTLADLCYYYMFNGCTSLTTAPELPATTLANSCYSSMFAGCTSLTTAPVLSATSLANSCYNGMFMGCSSLSSITAYFLTTPGPDYTDGWVIGVAAYGTFTRNENATWNVWGESGVPLDWDCYPPMEPPAPGGDYFAIEFQDSGNVYMNVGYDAEFSYNGGEWTNNINEMVNPGDNVQIRSRDNSGHIPQGVKDAIAGIEVDFRIRGDIRSLGFGEDYALYDLTNTYSYAEYLFSGNTYLVDAWELALPDTVGDRCYAYMFKDCTNLTSIPELPATTLVGGCYEGMFGGCTSLDSLPPEYLSSATTLAMGCYRMMFAGCTGLTSAPVELPATTLEMECYAYMFHSCTSLMAAPELPATTLTYGCYNAMFYGCSSLEFIKCMAEGWIDTNGCTNSWVMGVAANGTFVKSLNSNWDTGDNGIPSGWDVQIDTPFE